MTPLQILVALFIHLVVSAVGVVPDAFFCRHALRQGASTIFLVELFSLFFIYGGWLLTALFWEWSGMASLGALFLLFIGSRVLVARSRSPYTGWPTLLARIGRMQERLNYRFLFAANLFVSHAT